MLRPVASWWLFAARPPGPRPRRLARIRTGWPGPAPAAADSGASVSSRLPQAGVRTSRPRWPDPLQPAHVACHGVHLLWSAHAVAPSRSRRPRRRPHSRAAAARLAWNRPSAVRTPRRCASGCTGTDSGAPLPGRLPHYAVPPDRRRQSPVPVALPRRPRAAPRRRPRGGFTQPSFALCLILCILARRSKCFTRTQPAMQGRP